MKRNLLCGAVILLAGSLLAADGSTKDEVTSAAKKLADAANYTWKTTVAVPEGSRFRPGPTDGKTEKDGFTVVNMSRRDTTMEIVMKGDKAAINSPDNGWESLSEMDQQGPGRFLGMMVRNFKAPAAQATELVSATKELKQEGDMYSGDLTEDGAKSMLSFGRRRGGGGGPEISNAKGSVKFWVKDGVLSKYEFKVQGTMSFNGNERDIDRTTTTEISDVGTTKVTVPDEAKKKLS